MFNIVGERCLPRWKILQQWRAHGGLLLLGYDMFRSLLSNYAMTILSSLLPRAEIDQLHSTQGSHMSLSETHAEHQETIKQVLLYPGPHCVVLDEGHRIRSSSTQISKLLAELGTRRRIVLTGYCF